MVYSDQYSRPSCPILALFPNSDTRDEDAAMQNPIRTLLYGLFVAPVLRVLQSIFDGISALAPSAKSRQGTSRRTPAKATRPIRANDSRSHWEKMGVAIPVYKLAGQGLSDHDIAVRLNLSENTVYGCIGYLVRRLKCRTRAELVLYASPKQQETWSLRSGPRMLVSRVRRWRQRKLAASLLLQ